jgi:hypothetical protein
MEYQSDSNVYEESRVSLNHRVLPPFQLTDLAEDVLYSYLMMEVETVSKTSCFSKVRHVNAQNVCRFSNNVTQQLLPALCTTRLLPTALSLVTGHGAEW